VRSVTVPNVAPSGAELVEGLDRDHPACILLAERRERHHFFGDTLFCEAGWDMLLVLCCVAARGLTINARVLTDLSGVSASVAERWLVVLQDAGLVVRRHDLENMFFQTVELTDAGRAKMDDYFSRIGLKP
jgi:DNA-binding transcriptional ArsR family regulator